MVHEDIINLPGTRARGMIWLRANPFALAFCLKVWKKCTDSCQLQREGLLTSRSSQQVLLAAHGHGRPVASVPGLLVLVVTSLQSPQQLTVLHIAARSLPQHIPTLCLRSPSISCQGTRRDHHAAMAEGRQRNGQAVHGLTESWQKNSFFSGLLQRERPSTIDHMSRPPVLEKGATSPVTKTILGLQSPQGSRIQAVANQLEPSETGDHIQHSWEEPSGWYFFPMGARSLPLASRVTLPRPCLLC